MKPLLSILKKEVKKRDWSILDSKLIIKDAENNKDLIFDYLDVSFRAIRFAESKIVRNINENFKNNPTALFIPLMELKSKNYFVKDEKYFLEILNNAPLIIKNYNNPPISNSEEIVELKKLGKQRLMFEILFGNIIINKQISELRDKYIFHENNHFQKLKLFFAKASVFQNLGKPNNSGLYMNIVWDNIYLDRLYFLKEAFLAIKNNSLNWKLENIKDSEKLRIYFALPETMDLLDLSKLKESTEIIKSKIQTLTNADATIEDKIKRSFNWDKNKTHSNNLYATKQNVIETIELLRKYEIKEVNQFFKDLIEHHNLSYEP